MPEVLAHGDMPQGLGLGIAVAIVGGVSFQLVYLFLLNHPDMDIQRYSKKIMSGIIAMFIAIVVFTFCDYCLDTYVASRIPEQLPTLQIVVSMGQLLFWLLVLQGKPRAHGVKSFAELVSNIACLAAMKAWCDLQSWAPGPFADNSQTSFAVLPVCLFVHTLFALLSGGLRSVKVGKDADSEDEAWDEAVEKSESNCMAFALSFLTLQSFRYWACGSLPGQLVKLQECAPGEAASALAPGFTEAQFLLLAAALSALLAALCMVFPTCPVGCIARVLAGVRTSISMFSAWCLAVAAAYLVGESPLSSDPMVVTVVAAIVVTILSILAIGVADACAAGGAGVEGASPTLAELPKMAKAMKGLIQILGLCTILTWLQTFRVALGDVQSLLSMPESCALVAFTLLVATPAWRHFIFNPAHGVEGLKKELSEVLLES